MQQDAGGSRAAYAGPFSTITLDKLNDGFDVDPGLEEEVGEFIAKTLFGQKSDGHADSTDGGEEQGNKDKKKGKKDKKSKSKGSSGSSSAASSDHKTKKKYDITGPYTPVPTEDDPWGYGGYYGAMQRSRAAKAVKAMRPAAPLEMAPPNDEPASAPMPRDSAVELLSTLGKSYEQGQLTEDDLQEFIKNVDLEFDDPRLLEDFERKNSEENAEDSIWKVTKAQADEPIGSPYHPRGQQQRLSAGADESAPEWALSADGCGGIFSGLFSCFGSAIQVIIALIIVLAILQFISSMSCFDACKLRDAWVSKQEEPPAPKGCSVFDKIPTACDLFNIPCQMMGCMGGSCGGGWSICDWLPSGGRVPPEQRGKKEDECAGFMQSLCQGICATAKREPSAGGGADVAQDDDEDFADDDGYIRGTGARDTSSLYMAVKHQRGGHGSPPDPGSRNRINSVSPARSRGRSSGPPKDPYTGPRKSHYGPNPVLDDFTDDVEFEENQRCHDGYGSTGGFTSPFVDDYEESVSASQDFGSTTGMGMHGYVPSPSSSSRSPRSRSRRSRR